MNPKLPYLDELNKLYALSYMRKSVVGTVELQLYSLAGFAYHPFQSKDRLGSDKIDFPIAYVYGDND